MKIEYNSMFNDNLSLAQKDAILEGLEKAINDFDPKDVLPGKLTTEDLAKYAGHKSPETIRLFSYQFCKETMIQIAMEFLTSPGVYGVLDRLGM